MPLVEHAYSNTIHSSNSKAPFEVIEGCPKLPLILQTHDKIFATDEYVHNISIAFQKTKEAITHAQEKHKKAAHKHQRLLAFKEDEWVLL